MNDFFDKVKNAVSKTAKDAAKVSNDAVAYTKLKFKISELNDRIDTEYKHLGMIVYQSTIDADVETDAIEGVCDGISELIIARDGLEEDLAGVTNKIRCSECGAKIAADSSYCSECGTKL